MNARPRGGRPAPTPAITAIAAIVVAGVAFAVTGATPWGQDLLARFVRPTAPERALGSPRLRAALVREGVLVPLPPAAGAATPSSAGGGCADLELGAGPRTSGESPATVAAPPEARESATPFVSLWLDPCRLARLHATPWKRGRGTEETGWVSIFINGAPVVETAVGVRLHGGISRENPPYGYRLYFRDAYGLDGVPGTLLDAGVDGTVSRLILAELDDKDSDGSFWFLPGETALAIGRRVGAETTRGRPIRFALAGETPRTVLASEHIGPDLLRRRFGHADFDIVRGKRETGDPAEAIDRAELDWIAAQPAPLLAAAVDARYDLDSLLSWLVSVVYSGTGDLYQDAMVRDRTGEVRGGRWFWIHWDHDMSFRTPPRNSRFGRFDDAFPYVVWSTRETDVAPSRALLVRLLTEDAAFRDRVAARFERAFSDELTPAFFEALIARQLGEARTLGFADLHFAEVLSAFFGDRAVQLRPRIAEVLAAAGDPATTRPPGLVRHRSRSASVNP